MIAPEITVPMSDQKPQSEKSEKKQEKMKKEGHIGNLSDMTGAKYCDTPLSRLARRTFKYSLAPWLP